MAADTITSRYSGLHAAVSAIAARCDGAIDQDGIGFDGTDTKFGRRVAAMPVELWDEAIAIEVSRILPKYRTQLASYGIDLSDVDLVHGEDRRHEARQSARTAEKRAQEQPYIEIGSDGTVRVFRSLYIKDVLKAAKFRFDGGLCCWQARLTPTAAEAILGLPEIQLTDSQRAALTVTADQPVPVKYDVDVLAGRLALDVDFGRLPLETIRSLPGRKWDGAVRVNWVDAHPALLEHGLTISPAALRLIEASRVAVTEAQAREADLMASSRATESGATVAIADQLYPFQRAGVAYALRARRALIGDEMGLGKTRQALSALETETAYPAVIVCPASLKGNWAREINALLPHRTVDVRSGRKASSKQITADILILNYDILAAHVPTLPAPAALVIDESHYVKEGKAQRTKAVRKLAGQVPASGLVLFLTGTPVVNRPKELVQQLLALGHLTEEKGHANSTGKFLFRYCGPVNNGWGWTFNGATNTEELNTWLRKTCMVRREKAQVLTELPAKVRAPQFTELTPAAYRAYRELEDQAADYAACTAAEALVFLTKVREAVGLAKIEQAVDWAENFLTTGKSLVIFAHHKAVQTALIDRLRAAGHDVTHILGGQPVAEIEAHKARFQAGESRVLVASLSAAREGHTLTAASDVLFVELGWTPGGHSQAEDRCHRIGQTDSVTAWYLLAEDTVDTDTYDLIENKRTVVRAVIDGTEETTQTAIAAELLARLLARHAIKEAS
jgi:SWI/SNF-related matrix-associated actin-dependent regulator of chromatin subfamily A-like protein 1